MKLLIIISRNNLTTSYLLWLHNALVGFCNDSAQHKDDKKDQNYIYNWSSDSKEKTGMIENMSCDRLPQCYQEIWWIFKSIFWKFTFENIDNSIKTYIGRIQWKISSIKNWCSSHCDLEYMNIMKNYNIEKTSCCLRNEEWSRR